MELTERAGLVATTCLTGLVTSPYADCLREMRSYCDRNNFHRIEWRTFEAKLVERARDAVCEHALKEKYDWLLMIDADAVFKPETLHQLLHTAYVSHPQGDMIGAYSQLASWPHFCTIDTGSGTWEWHFPNKGIIPVIRTGAHCILVKTKALRGFGPPWFRTRKALTAARAFAEVDNFARCKLDGKNPFTDSSEWDTLLAEAKRVSHSPAGDVGEDSGFCDALRAAGGQIFVNTDIVTGHVARKIIEPKDLIEARDKLTKDRLRVVGIL